MWENPQGEYTYSIRGSKLLVRDIWKDIKIAAGSKSQSDDQLVKSLRKFNEEHPGAKLNVAGHSLGTMLATNALTEVDIPGQKDVCAPAMIVEALPVLLFVRVATKAPTQLLLVLACAHTAIRSWPTAGKHDS